MSFIFTKNGPCELGNGPCLSDNGPHSLENNGPHFLDNGPCPYGLDMSLLDYSRYTNEPYLLYIRPKALASYVR